MGTKAHDAGLDVLSQVIRRFPSSVIPVRRPSWLTVTRFAFAMILFGMSWARANAQVPTTTPHPTPACGSLVQRSVAFNGIYDSISVPDSPSLNPTSGALFFDDFENPALPQWVGKDGGAHHGVVVNDPLRPGNHVLTFTALDFAGDIFGSAVSVTPGMHYVLSFEYLGLFIPGSGADPNDLGGFIGFENGPYAGVLAVPTTGRWLEGTQLGSAEDDALIDDGQWHTYTVAFDPFVEANGVPWQLTNNVILIVLEDFLGSGGVPGDAFFDNVSLIQVMPTATLTPTGTPTATPTSTPTATATAGGGGSGGCTISPTGRGSAGGWLLGCALVLARPRRATPRRKAACRRFS